MVIYVYIMAFTIKNERIITFYEANPHLSFEKVNLMMVDLLEKTMQSNMTPSIVTDMNNTILSLQHQMTEMNQTMSRIGTDTQTCINLKLVELKDSYIEQMKMLLSNNTSETIAPILRDNTSLFIDKTQLLLADLLPRNQESMKQDLRDTMSHLELSLNKESFNPLAISEYIHALDVKVSSALLQTTHQLSLQDSKIENGFKDIKEISSSNQSTVTSLLQKMENSSGKGLISENILNSMLQNAYPTADIQSVATTAGTGDVMLVRDDKPTILCENKLWSVNVVKKEVIKFIDDCTSQACCGILLSQQSGICNKNHFEIDIHDGCVLIYIHNVNYNMDTIRCAIDIIDHFKLTLDSINTDVTTNSIEKSVLDEINKEYNTHRQQKEAMQRMIRDTQGSLLKQVDLLVMPSLGKYLSKYYSSHTTGEIICEYCNIFSAVKKSGISSHQRGCPAKKAFLKKQGLLPTEPNKKSKKNTAENTVTLDDNVSELTASEDDASVNTK
jgi:hypothetical protein